MDYGRCARPCAARRSIRSWERGAVDDENVHCRSRRRQLQPQLLTDSVKQSRVVVAAGTLRRLGRTVLQLETVVTLEPRSVDHDTIDARHPTHVTDIARELAHCDAAP